MEVLLFRPPAVADAVVVEDDVRAAREAMPLLLGGSGADPQPEGDVGRDPEHPTSRTEYLAQSQDAASGQPSDAPDPVRVEERAELHLAQQRRVGAHQLDRRCAAGMTQPEI